MSAAEHGSRGDDGGRIAFDIPAQPLAKALATFGEATGFEIVADARQAHDRMSSPVTGVMQPHEALLALLAGTGLTVRDYAPGSARLVMATPPPSTFDEDFSPVRSPHTLYFAAVQRTILQAICRTDKDLLTSSRLAIKLWVAPSGAVARVKLLDRIGERGREEALSAAFEQSNIGLPPPADFQQPVTLVIQPKQSQDSRDCDGPGAEARHASNQ